jgi:hypothetical protein
MNLQYSAKNCSEMFTASQATGTLPCLQTALAFQQALDVLVIPQHSGLENAQLAQLLLYALLQVLEMDPQWLCELLCLAATWSQESGQSHLINTLKILLLTEALKCDEASCTNLCSMRSCAVSSVFVYCHVLSSRCIESTSSCKKSISLPSGLAALVSICIEQRRRSISRPTDSRSLRRPASHSCQHYTSDMDVSMTFGAQNLH